MFVDRETQGFRDVRVMKKRVLHSRREHKRVDNPQGVWVYWRCGRSEDTSRVRDISVGYSFGIDQANVTGWTLGVPPGSKARHAGAHGDRYQHKTQPGLVFA